MHLAPRSKRLNRAWSLSTFRNQWGENKRMSRMFDSQPVDGRGNGLHGLRRCRLRRPQRPLSLHRHRSTPSQKRLLRQADAPSERRRHQRAPAEEACRRLAISRLLLDTVRSTSRSRRSPVPFSGWGGFGVTGTDGRCWTSFWQARNPALSEIDVIGAPTRHLPAAPACADRANEHDRCRRRPVTTAVSPRRHLDTGLPRLRPHFLRRRTMRCWATCHHGCQQGRSDVRAWRRYQRAGREQFGEWCGSGSTGHRRSPSAACRTPVSSTASWKAGMWALRTAAWRTTFKSEDAAGMLAGSRDSLWPNVNPQSISYEFMQEPLLTGERCTRFDHTARLLDAFNTERTSSSPSRPRRRAWSWASCRSSSAWACRPGRSNRRRGRHRVPDTA